MAKEATSEDAEARYPDEQEAYTLAQLLELAGIAESELRELVEYGALAPVDIRATTWTFDAEGVLIAQQVVRLRREFALDDTHSACVILDFRARIESLERELRTLRALLG